MDCTFIANTTPSPVSATTPTHAQGSVIRSVATFTTTPVADVTTPVAVGHTHLAMRTNGS